MIINQDRGRSMNKFFLIIFFISWQFIASAHILTSMDSIGVTTRNKEKFIVHEVEAGETLFSLAQKYHVDMDELTRINPILKNDGLKAGSRIFIPIAKQTNAETPATVNGMVYHIVKPQETMFSISREYGVSIEQIREWNHLSGNSIDIGQKILIKKNGGSPATNITAAHQEPGISDRKKHTVKATETLYGISRIYDVTTDQLRAWNNLPDNNISIGQELIVSPPKTEKHNETGDTTVKSTASNSSMLPGSVVTATTTANKTSDNAEVNL